MLKVHNSLMQKRPINIKKIGKVIFNFSYNIRIKIIYSEFFNNQLVKENTYIHLLSKILMQGICSPLTYV